MPQSINFCTNPLSVSSGKTQNRKHRVKAQNLYPIKSTIDADLALADYCSNSCSILKSTYFGFAVESAPQRKIGQFVKKSFLG